VNNVEQIIVGPTKETKNIQCFTAGASGQSAYPSMCKRIGQFLPNDRKEQWPSVGNDLVEVNIKIHAAKHFLDQLKNPPREGTANAKWMAAIRKTLMQVDTMCRTLRITNSTSAISQQS
jgi:hypothetical protein